MFDIKWQPLGIGLHLLDAPEGEWTLSVMHGWPTRIFHPEGKDIANAQSFNEAKLLVQRLRSDETVDPLADQLEATCFTADTTDKGIAVWKHQQKKSLHRSTVVIRTKTGVVVRYGRSANMQHEVARLDRRHAPELRTDAEDVVIAHALDMIERRHARGGSLTRPL